MAKKVVLTFDNRWVLSKKDSAMLPVKAFVKSVDEIFKSATVIDETFTICEMLVKDEGIGEEEISNRIFGFIKQKFNVEAPNEVVRISVTEYKESEAVKTDEGSDEPKIDMNDILGLGDDGELEEITESEASINSAEKLDEVISKINALVGAEEFKGLAEECMRVAPGLRKYNTVEAFTHQSYIFAINDGNGLTTYLDLFADLLGELKLFKSKEKNRIAEEKLLPFRSNLDTQSFFGSALAQLRYNHANGGKIICIDISEWMTNIGEKCFRDFLSEIDDNSGKDIIIFRIPFVEKEILDKIEKAIGDILYVRALSFVPFDNIELTKCAEDTIAEMGFTMTEEAWKIFNTRITEEKSDGRFYGINTIKKVIREMIYRKQLHNALNDIDDTVIKCDEISGLAQTYNKNQKSGIEMLDDFIGMEAIKSRVEEIIAQITVSAQNKSLGHPCIHMRFVGNPGTGKTTVARVIGQILKEKGILRNGNFFEHSGRDFCGVYVGQTAPKTSGICRDAYGSVLFIDEAYSLYRDEGYSSNDFGREAIDTLIAEMENHRSDLVVIMAGYPDEMETLMKANAGLESRMPYIIEFPNYTRDQLFDIFMLMVNKSFKYKEGFEEAVKEYFDSLPDEVLSAKEFSNARFVRNLFERTWGKAVMRTQLNKGDAAILIKEDFLLASGEKEFKKIMQKPARRALGFI